MPSMSKQYRIVYETFRNGSHVYHVRQAEGKNAREVRERFVREYGYIRGEKPYPYYLSVKPWKDGRIESSPNEWEKVMVRTENRPTVWQYARATRQGFRACYDGCLIPVTVVAEWKPCVI